MNAPVKEENKNGLVIRIFQDTDPQNPRTDCDNFGTMVCFHRKYSLGDKNCGFRNLDDAVEFEKSMRAQPAKGVLLPLFMMDHSGLTINTEGFRAMDPQGFDWGKIGFIYVDAKKMKAEGVDADQARRNLQAEVDTYNKFVGGDVYGYVIETPTGEEIDSCWGFYGMDSVEAAVAEVLEARSKVAV